MTGEIFQHLTDLYEATIDWPKRLAGEEPFYRRWFAEAQVKSVVDVACGTGRHAAMFHAWGLRVEGADLSPQMIERARAAFGAPGGLSWAVRGFDAPAGPPGSFDAAVCVGNSLALAPDAATARRAIDKMFAAVRPGGLVVVQVLNLWRLADGPCLWQKCLRRTLLSGDVLILKGIHRSGPRGFVDLVVMRPEGGEPLFHESLPLLGIEAAELEEAARRAGATDVHLFGDYHDQPYRPAESADLVMVARK
jgi:SAM-dependent methyltransferase